MAGRGRGSLVSRLLRAEEETRLKVSLVSPEIRDDDYWLAAFEEYGRQGLFDAEPDFPLAVAFLRDALARAHASVDPPYDPPPDFYPFEHPQRRQEFWRSRERFPDVVEGSLWLFEICCRGSEGVPPVTEEEFRQLAEWFYANETRLSGLARSQLQDVGGGRKIAYYDIRDRLEKGPRAFGAGEVAEEVRQLRAKYG